MTLCLAMFLLIALCCAAADAANTGRRSQTAQQLNRGLAGTPMLERVGFKHRIHPISATKTLRQMYPADDCPRCKALGA